MDRSFAVRKGAWTEEEDLLLRRCIEKYGEGKWRQVPLRAGLRRCRKSCRLRWLNYLRPDINRGEFKQDEVDLLLRLHRLLGNRWSLIAGRIPGRTANDIKNFWNTRLKKKTTSTIALGGAEAEARSPVSKKNEVIKPRPWTFPKCSPWLRRSLCSFTSPDSFATDAGIISHSREMVGVACPILPSTQGSRLEQESDIFYQEPEKGTRSSLISGCAEDPITSGGEEVEARNHANKKNDFIKPRPWTFPKCSAWLQGSLSSSPSSDSFATNTGTTNHSKEMVGMTCSILPSTQGSRLEQKSNSFDKEQEKGYSNCISGCAEDLIRSPWVEALQPMPHVGNNTSLEEGNIVWDDDFFLDFFWDTPVIVGELFS